MASQVASIKPKEKVMTPVHKNVVDCLKKLRSHPKLGKAVKKKLPLENVFQFDAHGTKCVVVQVKMYILSAIKKILKPLRAELESLLGREVYFVGYRRIIPKPAKRSAAAKVHRPFRRTITGVHESILEDLIFPSEVMGKRTVYRPHAGKFQKVFLDQKLRGEMEHRLSTMSAVYKRLTRRDVRFEFPLYDCPMRMDRDEKERQK